MTLAVFSDATAPLRPPFPALPMKIWLSRLLPQGEEKDLCYVIAG